MGRTLSIMCLFAWLIIVYKFDAPIIIKLRETGISAKQCFIIESDLILKRTIAFYKFKLRVMKKQILIDFRKPYDRGPHHSEAHPQKIVASQPRLDSQIYRKQKRLDLKIGILEISPRRGQQAYHFQLSCIVSISKINRYSSSKEVYPW